MDCTGGDELRAFLDAWKDDALNIKKSFKEYMEFLAAQDRVSLSFKARPGVSYSLRARHAAQSGRELFVLVDVVDDEPQSRWLSVCFYDDMVTDPGESGDFVPEGLMGENARCFNLEDDEPRTRAYIQERLAEAVRSACAGGA